MNERVFGSRIKGKWRCASVSCESVVSILFLCVLLFSVAMGRLVSTKLGRGKGASSKDSNGARRVVVVKLLPNSQMVMRVAAGLHEDLPQQVMSPNKQEDEKWPCVSKS